MTTALIAIAAAAGLAGLVFYWLWRRERRKRIQAEKAAEMQRVRADAETELRKQIQAAEAEWRAKLDKLGEAADAARDEAQRAREALVKAVNDPSTVADMLNKVLHGGDS